MKVESKSSDFYIIFGEIKGFEWFFKHFYDTYLKVYNMFHHIL